MRPALFVPRTPSGDSAFYGASASMPSIVEAPVLCRPVF